MKKIKKALLIDPYINICGGGEKHFFQIGSVLLKHGYKITVNTTDIKTLELLKQRFELDFTGCDVVDFYRLSKINRLVFLKKYDIVFYVTDGSYFLSPAAKNYIFCMYPDGKLYKRIRANKIKWLNWQFISNSYFTKQYIDNWTNKNSTVIYPYIDKIFINDKNNSKKDPLIISVGRYFSHLHNKNHIFLIDTFKKMQQQYPGFKKFNLVIIGGLDKNDAVFFAKLKRFANESQNIKVLANISKKELLSYYSRAMIYWHGAGFGIDETVSPHKVEHFGITPLEAMAAGTIVFCPQAGEMKRLIKDGSNGYFYRSRDELIQKTYKISQSYDIRKKISRAAKEFIRNKFDYQTFEQKVKQTLQL